MRRHIVAGRIVIKLSWKSPATVCVTSEIAIKDPDNGLSPDLRQAIISTNAVLLLIGPYFNR